MFQMGWVSLPHIVGGGGDRYIKTCCWQTLFGCSTKELTIQQLNSHQEIIWYLTKSLDMMQELVA